MMLRFWFCIRIFKSPIDLSPWSPFYPFVCLLKVVSMEFLYVLLMIFRLIAVPKNHSGWQASTKEVHGNNFMDVRPAKINLEPLDSSNLYDTPFNFTWIIWIINICTIQIITRWWQSRREMFTVRKNWLLLSRVMMDCRVEAISVASKKCS